MAVIVRPYKDENDLFRMQALTQHINSRSGGVGLLHTGDIPHRVFNAGKRYQPHDLVYLWEDGGQLVAWLLFFPAHGGFDLAIHPDYFARLEGDFLAQAEHLQRQVERRYAIEAQPSALDVLAADTATIGWLEMFGYSLDKPMYGLTTRPLDDAIPEPRLPEGFTMRSAEGEHEADKLIEVHSGGFGSTWTVEQYVNVMQSPGYDVERELVAVAPDGRFAAFCIIWVDLLNKTGLFEPVGAQSDFRRLGLTRALMYEGMRRMQAVGIETAIVVHAVDNPAAKGLYTAVGFRPRDQILSYHKPLS